MKRVCFLLVVGVILSGQMVTAQDKVLQVAVANFSFKGTDDTNLRTQLPKEFNNQLRSFKKLCPKGLKFLSERQQDAEEYIININDKIKREYGVKTTQLSVPRISDVLIFAEFINNGSEITMDIGVFTHQNGLIIPESEKTVYFDRTLSTPNRRKKFIKKAINEVALNDVLKMKLDELNVECRKKPVNKWVYVGAGAAILGGGLYWLLKGLPKPPNNGVPPDE